VSVLKFRRSRFFCFKYLNHSVTNDLSDAVSRREIHKVFLRANILARKFHNYLEVLCTTATAIADAITLLGMYYVELTPFAYYN